VLENMGKGCKTCVDSPDGGIRMDSERITVGSPAPDFTLPAADGRSVHLGDFREKQRLVVFFMRAFG
jgi:peroxiredoxin